MPSLPTPLELPRLPSLASELLRALVSRKPARAMDVPGLAVRVRNVLPDAWQLARYRAVCGFGVAGALPATFPQVLATPLHLALLNRPEFPYRLLGMVHVRNLIRQHRPLQEGEPLSLSCWVEGQREARLGREIDLHTRVEAGGALVWEAVSTMLRRLPTAAEPARGPRAPGPEAEEALFREVPTVSWRVPEDTGRQYARASGDYNPIHLHALAARPFGFSRAIAHGMWTVGRCMAELGPAARVPVLTLACDFRRPLLLPAHVRFQSAPHEGGLAFRVSSQEGKAHVVGRLVAALQE